MKKETLLERMDLTLAAFRWLSIPEHLALIEHSCFYQMEQFDLLVELLNNDELRVSQPTYLKWYLNWKFERTQEDAQLKNRNTQDYLRMVKDSCLRLYSIEEGTEEDLIAGMIRTALIQYKGVLNSTKKMIDHAVSDFEHIDWYSSVSHKVQASLEMTLLVENKNNIMKLKTEVSELMRLLDKTNAHGKEIFKQTMNTMKIIDNNIEWIDRVYNAAYTMRRVEPLRRQYVKPMMLASTVTLEEQRTSYRLLMNDSDNLEEIGKVLAEITQHVPRLRLLSKDSENIA